MGAEARAAAEQRDENNRKITMLSDAVLSVLYTEAERLGVDLNRLALVFDVDQGNGNHGLGSVYVGSVGDDMSDEVLLAIRNLEAVGVKKYGMSRKVLAECILGADVTLELAPPERPPGQPEQRPARHRGQRRRPRAR